MKILVTGFDPFGGMDTNPTSELAKGIRTVKFPNTEIYSKTLPVVYDQCTDVLIEYCQEINPDYIICCGLAYGRTAISIERIGINIKDTGGEGQRGDNSGEKPVDVKIVENGPDGLFSTLPIRELITELHQNFIPAEVSNSAGTYICNNTLYGILHFIKKHNLQSKAGFIHFPATPEMVVQKPNVASMSYDLQFKALQVIINKLIQA